MPQPKSIGGHAKQTGAELQEFCSFCPPDVQPRTRILAVCGINDQENSASPERDGWFLSDFYLFHYLLENTGEASLRQMLRRTYSVLTQQTDTFHAANQLWFTCLEPRYLAQKYTEYVHVSRNGDRRVVLDKARLERIESSNTLRVVPPKDLLERFLATLRSETQIAAAENQQVLVLVFGHGDDTTYGVSIGGLGTNAAAPKLTQKAFDAAVQSGVELNLLITSCFFGGWVIKPMKESNKKLNITGMTAVNASEESISWAKSTSCGRAGGSVYATAVFNALMQTTEADKLNSSDPSALDNEEIYGSPTYINLCNAVYDASKEIDPFFRTHGISFAAQDDKWDSEWRTRSGFPLVHYREKWEGLRQVHSDQSPSQPDSGATLGFRGGIGRSYGNVLQVKAQLYLDSFPGPDNVGPNVEHGRLRKLVAGENFPENILDSLDNILDYRLSVLKLATNYASYLGLDFPDAFKVDTDGWLKAASMNLENDEKSTAATWYERVQEVRSRIIKKRLFDKPGPSQGWPYSKPRDYLAIALLSSSWDQPKIFEAIDTLLVRKYTISCRPDFLGSNIGL